MAKTSADITKEADALQARLAAMRKEARKMKRLEDQKAAEAQRQEEIRFALAFVETAKGMYFRDGSRSYFDYICAKMTEQQSDQSADSVPPADSTEHGSGQTAYQTAGY